MLTEAFAENSIPLAIGDEVSAGSAVRASLVQASYTRSTARSAPTKRVSSVGVLERA
jgi:hypothetical protein